MSAAKKDAKSGGASVKASRDVWAAESYYRPEKSFEGMMADIRAVCAEVRAREQRAK